MYKVPKEYIESLKEDILSALKKQKPSETPVAAFDADGTLWFCDVGRNFFEYQMEHNYFPKGQALNWDDYQKAESLHINDGLIWMAQILEGAPLTEVQQKVRDFHDSRKPIYIEHQKEIISFLKEQGVRVLIVTASVKWSIEAGALELGVEPKDIVGIETEVENGIITGRFIPPLSYAEGKVEALLKATQGQNPFFVSGNSFADIFMLRMSNSLRQVIQCAPPEDYLYESECRSLAEAKEKGWHYVDFNNKTTSLDK